MGDSWNWLGATLNVRFRCYHCRNVGFFCDRV